jgi:hypothetical protein
MKNDKSIGLDFIVDKLTNSIENVVTGDSFKTEISVLTKSELKLVTKKNAWEGIVSFISKTQLIDHYEEDIRCFSFWW